MGVKAQSALLLRAGAGFPPSRERRRQCAHLIFHPVVAPSSGGSRWGKARMSEAMDGRVRAGHRIPSNAENGGGFIAATRTSGVLLFAYYSLGQARESRSAAPKAMSKALDETRLMRLSP